MTPADVLRQMADACPRALHQQVLAVLAEAQRRWDLAGYERGCAETTKANVRAREQAQIQHFRTQWIDQIRTSTAQREEIAAVSKQRDKAITELGRHRPIIAPALQLVTFPSTPNVERLASALHTNGFRVPVESRD